jgi:outer membrane protein assembly factor BamB
MRSFTNRTVAILAALAVATTALAPVAARAAGPALWSITLDADAAWYRVTSVGTLLAATDKALASLDPETGRVAWRRDDLPKTDEHQVLEVEGTPLLLVNENSGRFAVKTRLVALDILTGETVWETE